MRQAEGVAEAVVNLRQRRVAVARRRDRRQAAAIRRRRRGRRREAASAGRAGGVDRRFSNLNADRPQEARRSRGHRGTAEPVPAQRGAKADGRGQCRAGGADGELAGAAGHRCKGRAVRRRLRVGGDVRAADGEVEQDHVDERAGPRRQELGKTDMLIARRCTC